MRKSFYTLSGLVRTKMGKDPLDGSVYVFINARRDRIKLLHMEPGGLVLYMKVLERGELHVPQRLSGLVLDNGTGQIAEFTTDTIDTVQDEFLSMFEIGEDVLGPYLSVGSWVFHPEVVADADMVLDSVFVEPFEPLITDKLTVRYQAFDTVTTEQADESLYDIDFFLAIGVSPLGQQSEQDGERHMIVSYAKN